MSKTEQEKPALSVVSTARWEELEAKAAKADELQDKVLRTAAEWDNYRKRMQREKEEASRYAVESFLEKLLPVLDNFELGLQAARTSPDTSSIIQGLNMVSGQLAAFLKDAGIEPIDALGQPFDPHLHEALGQKESAEHPEGTVLQQMRRGYKLKNRLLRPAAVFVAKTPSASPAHS
jgi:molecular chaperone GrpE